MFSAVMSKLWDLLDPFSKGFVAIFISFGIIAILLWLLMDRISKIFSPKAADMNCPVSESTDWLNFILESIMPHFDNQESTAKISKAISRYTSPNRISILSLGNPPVIKEVTTLEMKDGDDIRILVPIQWINGVSLDFFLSKSVCIELDLHYFNGTILLTWPGGNNRKMELRFNETMKLDFDFSIRFLGGIRLSLTAIPIIGAIVKDIVALAISRKQFPIELPRPVESVPQNH